MKALSRSSRGVPTSALPCLQSLQQVTAGQPNSASLIPRRAYSSPKASFTRSKTLDQHSFVKHSRARAAAALGHWSLVFDPRAMPAESSLRPSEMSIHRASSAPVALSLQAKTAAMDRWHRPPRSTAKGEIHVSRPYHLKDARSSDHRLGAIFIDVVGRQVESPSDRDEGRCISIFARMPAQQTCHDFNSRFAVTSFSEAEDLK